MLIYHPAYDIYHTSFRIIQLLNIIQQECIETERLRIFDFIVLFPHELNRVTLPVDYTQIRKNYVETEYNKVYNKKKVYAQIEHYFDLSLQCLISYGAIDIEKYKEGWICKAKNYDEILERVPKETSFLDIHLSLLFSKGFKNISMEELKRRFQ